MSDDYVICDVCGKKQYEKDGPIGGLGRILCKSCWYAEQEESIPAGCMACGGPYPDCKSSCKLFDE